MDTHSGAAAPDETPGVVANADRVRARYWAGARAAAGRSWDDVPVAGVVSLAEVRELVLAQHGHDARLAQVLGVCSVLVDEQPVSSSAPDRVQVRPGATVEFLPPFAGG